PGTTSYAMFSIMDFLPTLASICGGKLPTDRAIDGVDQTDVLLGRSAEGQRKSLISFVGPEMVAVRWKQWRAYFTDMRPTGTGTQVVGATATSNAAMLGYFKAFDVESDPREELNVSGLNGWIGDPVLETVIEYERSVKKYPTPPAPNITRFGRGGWQSRPTCRSEPSSTRERSGDPNVCCEAGGLRRCPSGTAAALLGVQARRRRRRARSTSGTEPNFP